MSTRKRTGAATAAPAPPDPAETLRALLPELSPTDIFRGVVPITFGSKRYELQALSMEEDEQWIAGTDGSMRTLLEGVRAGKDDVAAILPILMSATDTLLDAIYAYDKHGVLPPREEVKRTGRAIDALRGAYSIWVSTNPTLAAGLAMQTAAATTNGTSAAPTSSTPPPTAGRPKRSAKAR